MWEHGGELNYVVDTKDQEFIFEFAKQAKVGNSALLVALHRKKSHEMIEEAFKVFEFDQDDLSEAASDLELMCSPDDLVNLLGKIEKQEDQEGLFEMVLWSLLVSERTECLEPLLNALDGNESFKHLKDVAIKEAFDERISYGNKSIVERLYDHPAVTSEDYAEGLFILEKDPHRTRFSSFYLERLIKMI